MHYLFTLVNTPYEYNFIRTKIVIPFFCLTATAAVSHFEVKEI